MSGQNFFLFVFILILLLTGCVSPATSETPNPPTPATKTVNSPTNSPATEVVNPYLNCLSDPMQMNEPRAAHTGTLLPDGRVLIAGGFRQEGTSEIPIASAEIFDPATNSFTPTGDMNEPRVSHVAVLLPIGQVLIVGGWSSDGRSGTAELYDPETGSFQYTGSMMAPRDGMTATLLESGRVLIAGGGYDRNSLQITAELYDPSTGEFISSGNLNVGRRTHTATLLKDGRVLLVGGNSVISVLSSAEIYDPVTGEFTLTGEANEVRYKHAAVLLQDGTVLIIGGSDHNDWNGKYTSAEIFDPDAGRFMQTSEMNEERFKLMDAALLLPDGNVLVAGGNQAIEIFDVQDQRFIPGGSLDNHYYYSVATLLKTGSVLITGGYDSNIRPSDQAWLYCPTHGK